MWEAIATVLPAIMAAIYGGKIQWTLKNPVGRQKKAPTAIAAAGIICGFWPWSRYLEMEPSIGAAKIKPIPQEREVHSNGENLALLMLMDLFVMASYLQFN